MQFQLSRSCPKSQVVNFTASVFFQLILYVILHNQNNINIISKSTSRTEKNVRNGAAPAVPQRQTEQRWLHPEPLGAVGKRVPQLVSPQRPGALQ
jgi:hypothetical protein